MADLTQDLDAGRPVVGNRLISGSEAWVRLPERLLKLLN